MRLTAKIKRPDKEDLIVYTKGTYEDTIPAEMTNNDIRAILKKLADYEDAEEQGLPNRWIPCSEQIPEEPEENPLFEGKCLEVYLVTTKYGSSEQDRVYPFRAFWNGINFTDGMNILDVIAWMPLPKPYRESEGEYGE